MAGSRLGGCLVLLVGSNPLPNFLAAAALKPERALLVYTEETERPKRWLEEALRERLGVEVPAGPGGSRWVANAAEAHAVLKACGDLPPDARLNYTGGTKVMATHARAAFIEAGGTPDRASYVDGARGVLRFDDGTTEALPEDCLDLEVVLGLHGLKRVNSDPVDHGAGIIAEAALNDPDLADQLHRWIKDDNGKGKKPADARADPLHPSELGLDLPDPIPAEDWTRKQIEGWLHFLGGAWLDVWVRERLQAAVPGATSHANVQVRRHNGRDFEVDVVGLVGHRVLVVSCTTDRTLALCKSKAFEVALRARQLGGDLASAALVCFLGDAELDNVRLDVDSVWSESNRPAVFGLSHLRAWRVGDRQSLARWAQR